MRKPQPQVDEVREVPSEICNAVLKAYRGKGAEDEPDLCVHLTHSTLLSLV